MKVSETGEFGLIDLVRRRIAASRDAGQEAWQRLLLGPGDDCAAWRGTTATQLATTDTMVEGVHFIPGTFKWEELGWKAMAANLSDIAAMGGLPRYALLSLSLPPDTEVESVIWLASGMIDLGSRHGVALAGGNMTSAPVAVITMAVVGELAGDAMLVRSAARPGDLVAVTGSLGASAAAVAAFTGRLKVGQRLLATLKKAHFHPQPRIGEGQALLSAGVRTAIDISDGLLSDLTRVCEASGVGAVVDAGHVPVHPALKRRLGELATAYAMSGGEDFELLFAAPADIIQAARSLISLPVTVLGRIVADHPGRVVVLDAQGRKVRPEATGWDHFSR